MKKFVALIALCAMVFTLLVGCSGGMKDNTYKAEGKVDERGWKPQIEVTIKGGKITDVKYDEVDKNGKMKSTDAEYAKNMSAKTKITPAEAYDKLKKDLIAKQDPAKDDTVAGAPNETNSFKDLAKQALKK